MDELIQKYQDTDIRIVKFNLYSWYKENFKMYGGRSEFAKVLGITDSRWQSYINPSNIGRIPFESIIRICAVFSIDYEILFVPVDWSKQAMREKKWTKVKIKEFLNYVDLYGIKNASKFYELSEKSVMTYVENFQKNS